ncbi:DCC1-like thiol-disulfide oxidoreductase family protein [uncultured Chitinophaga sp.]|jgi:Uncharacterized protein conserved in bacteria|uniref:thiol-disulfide oxidoreductase DCC family protein n=1 Tax=uncultured Chitinophaga sp. TaxID=339340 RepID=UPI002634F8C9|nr:DCC1-like thiol-disulfide oxidoreductase family protein [uncultured Chitinophaga sp.]
MQADNIILFDGRCTFCNGFIRRVLKVDRVRFRLCDQQSRLFNVIAQEHRLRISTGTIYLIQGGKAYARGRAVARILRGCNRRYRMLGRMMLLVPPVISNLIFKRIAKGQIYPPHTPRPNLVQF